VLYIRCERILIVSIASKVCFIKVSVCGSVVKAVNSNLDYLDLVSI